MIPVRPGVLVGRFGQYHDIHDQPTILVTIYSPILVMEGVTHGTGRVA
jgi:hypothetical protein